MEKYIQLAKKLKMEHAVIITPDQIAFDVRALLKCRWGCEDYFSENNRRCHTRGTTYEERVEMVKRYSSILLMHSHDVQQLSVAVLEIERDLNIAVNYFKEAIALDSDFALAYTYLARSYLNIYWFHFDPSPYPLLQSKVAIDAAFRIDPELPEAYIALAEYYYHGFLDYSNALVQLEAASEYMPDHPDCSFYKACVYRRMNDWEKAIIDFLDAYQGDPGSIWYLGDLVGTYLSMGEYQKALDFLDKLLLNFPEDATGYRLRIHTYLLRDGNVLKAREVLKDAANLNISEIKIMSSHNFFPLLDL